MADNDFLIPPFNPASARATLQRTLRDLTLTEREGVFEMKGLPVARLEAGPTTIAAGLARRLSRSPEWDASTLKDHADVRRFIDDLKKRLTRWSDARGDD